MVLLRAPLRQGKAVAALKAAPGHRPCRLQWWDAAGRVCWAHVHRTPCTGPTVLLLCGGAGPPSLKAYVFNRVLVVESVVVWDLVLLLREWNTLRAECQDVDA